MAPPAAISGTHSVRRMRKRQSRHAGKTCKGCATLSDSIVDLKLVSSGESKEVISTEQVADVVWQTYFKNAVSKLVTAKIGNYPDGPADSIDFDVKAYDEVVSTYARTKASLEAGQPSGPGAANVHSKAFELSETMVKASSLALDSRKQELPAAPAPDVYEGVEALLSVSLAAVQAEDAAESNAPEVPEKRVARKDVRRVDFDLHAISMLEVIPYAEIYGVHPRTFVFDRDSQKIPAARGGYVSADAVSQAVDDMDDDGDDCDSSEDDGDWESWLLEQEQSDDYPDEVDRDSLQPRAQFEQEMSDNFDDALEADQLALPEVRTCCEDRLSCESEPALSMEFTAGTCLPALGDVTGWELWLESTLGSAQEDLFCDPY